MRTISTMGAISTIRTINTIRTTTKYWCPMARKAIYRNGTPYQVIEREIAFPAY